MIDTVGQEAGIGIVTGEGVIDEEIEVTEWHFIRFCAFVRGRFYASRYFLQNTYLSFYN